MTSVPATHSDLTDAQIAVLATVGPDGRPQVTALWFLYEPEADRFRLSLNTARQKVKNLRANPAVTLLVVDATGYRTLEVRGDAVIEPDDDYRFADRVGAKYGSDLRAMDGPGEHRVVVTIDPARVNAVDLTGAAEA